MDDPPLVNPKPSGACPPVRARAAPFGGSISAPNSAPMTPSSTIAVACLRRSSYELEIFLAFGGRLDRQPGRNIEGDNEHWCLVVVLIDLAMLILDLRRDIAYLCYVLSSILKQRPKRGDEPLKQPNWDIYQPASRQFQPIWCWLQAELVRMEEEDITGTGIPRKIMFRH